MRKFLISCNRGTIDRIKALIKHEGISIHKSNDDCELLLVNCLPDDADRISRITGVNYVSQAPRDDFYHDN
jgi:hypothetical protein